ncbi:hypothetical protein EAE96_010588 [Botrytis aclada]|nr:hypothetical protein EAE96_010588 [Botrytis aclada]
METSQEVQLEQALRREDRAFHSSTPTSVSASIRTSTRASAPVTPLREELPAFQVAKRQFAIKSREDCHIPGSNFQLKMAQLRHHNKRIYRSRHGDEPTGFEPTEFVTRFIAMAHKPVEYQQYPWPTLHTYKFQIPRGPAIHRPC